MDVAIRPTSYASILQAPNAQELISAYAEECSIPEIGAALPQSDTYALLEASGVLHAFGVYKGDELIGFATLLLAELPHYGRKVATVESIFVAHEYRAGGVGQSLLLAVEQYADDHECAAILYSAPTGSRFNQFLGYLPEYRHTNNVYCRRLQ